MPDDLAVHFTTAPPGSATVVLACEQDAGLVDATEWRPRSMQPITIGLRMPAPKLFTTDPADATCAACIASPAWVAAARAVIADALPADRPAYMLPLRGRHRRPELDAIVSVRGRLQLEGHRVRVLEELAVAAWSLAIAPPRTAPSFPAPPGGDGTADRVVDELRLRQFVADEIAAIFNRRPDLAVRYVTAPDWPAAPFADEAPYVIPAPSRDRTGWAGYPATMADRVTDPYGWPDDDPALD